MQGLETLGGRRTSMQLRTVGIQSNNACGSTDTNPNEVRRQVYVACRRRGIKSKAGRDGESVREKEEGGGGDPSTGGRLSTTDQCRQTRMKKGGKRGQRWKKRKRQQTTDNKSKGRHDTQTGWPSTSFCTKKTTPGFVALLSLSTPKMNEIRVIIKGRECECVFGDGERKENHLQGQHS